MNCKECGYIKDEYEERMTYCDKYFPVIKDIGLLGQGGNIIKDNQIKQLEEVKIFP